MMREMERYSTCVFKSNCKNVFHCVQHSWKCRCQNVDRASRQDGAPRKRIKLNEHSAVHFIPPTNADDDVSFGRNLELLKAEMGKAKPRVDVLKDMLRRTFPNRWETYINGNDPSTLLEYLSQYPLLKKATYVCIPLSLHMCTCTIGIHMLAHCV